MENNKNDKEVMFIKIPLEAFIDTLIHIYKDGASFIDLVGTPDETQDSIGIIVRDEYMTDAPEEHNDSDDGETNLEDLA